MGEITIGEMMKLFTENYKSDQKVNTDSLESIKDWIVHYTKQKDPDDPSNIIYLISLEEPN